MFVNWPNSSAKGRFFAPEKSRPAQAVRAICVALGAAPGSQAIAASDPAMVATNPVFDSQFLRGLSKDIDLSRFAEAGVVTPGSYLLDITLNGKQRMQQQVRVSAEGKTMRYCFSAADAIRWGAKLKQLPDQEAVKHTLASECVEAQTLIPGASFSMDVSSLTGKLSIPQAYVGRIKRGYVDPSEWDQGINAAILSYHANAYRNEQDGHSNTDYTANLNGGLNVAGWRLRHNGNYRSSSEGGGGYQGLNSYAQTDVDAAQAQLTAGEYFTPGNSFDSIPFSGVQLASDDSMLPESERGFAPVIQGTAQTNAKVTVRQSGNVIYETSVAPGAFQIDDLYATGYAGDLEVTVTEADGREKRFTVPFASVVQMLRPGSSRFNLAAGRYRDDSLSDTPWFTQGTYRRGISNTLTLYGGGIVGEDYRSLLAGTALGTPIGAVAFDVTVSHAQGLPTERGESDTLSGRSYRVSYSKLLDYTHTNFALAAYRFSSDGYLNLGDFVRMRDGDDVTLRERNRFQVSINQPLGDAGSLNVTGLMRNYWNEQSSSTTFQVGYNKGFKWGSVSVSVSRDLQDDAEQNSYMLTFSVPLGSGSKRPLLSTSATYDSDGNASLRSNLSGTAGQNDQMNYGVYASRSETDTDTSDTYGGNLEYRNSATRLGASYSQGEGFKQYSASTSGTVVAYSGGVVTSPERGDTLALIDAAAAAGAPIADGQGNRLDEKGQGIVTGLMPYRQNRVGLDPQELPVDVELDSTQQQVVPRRGAVVKLDFAGRSGKPLLLRLRGTQVPFGAVVVDSEGHNITMVGQGGLIFLRGEPEGLRVIWGQASEHSCRLQFQPSEADQDNPYQAHAARCDGAQG